MAAQVPQKLQAIAAVQIVSGILNLVVMGLMVATVVGGGAGTLGSIVGALFTLLGCPFGCLFSLGWLCGLWGLVLVPIGMIEILCGTVILVNPDGAGGFAKAGMMTELASVVFGGVFSFVAGIVVLNLLKDAEVAGFLESGGQGAP